MTLATPLVFGLAGVAGSIAAVACLAAWRLCFPAGSQAHFWNRLSALAQDILVVDETAAFLALYRRLAVVLFGYLARNLGFAALAGAAVVAALLLVVLPLQSIRDENSGRLKASDPVVEATVRRDGERLSYAIGGTRVAVPAARTTRAAICWTSMSCTAAALFDFTIVETAATTSVAGPVIVRNDHGDINPLWPWLSDLEAFAFATLIVTGLGAGFGRRPAAAATATSVIGQGDFALIQINTQLGALVRLAGRIESRLTRRRLGNAPPVAPIFIAGLARSGTTTVLDALARSPELGSHQYRDFPFLAAPLLWNWLQGNNAPAVAVERPHKDSIRITKSSPEAFEEPLWQSFFPHVHDAAADQSLTVRTSHPKFEAFFADHLRKIVALRGAARYVSKGNYNLGRLGYLARLFPDATFIVPIRAPLDHIASLARQHVLFKAYAERDPRVPSYLRAAGHYEFGPQRRPICLSAETVLACNAYWAEGDDVLGYARQWAEVYGHVARLRAADPELARRLMIVRYEDLCARPRETLRAICDLCDLDDGAGKIAAAAATISLSDAKTPPAIVARRAEIFAVVGTVATEFGYA